MPKAKIVLAAGLAVLAAGPVPATAPSGFASAEQPAPQKQALPASRRASPAQAAFLNSIVQVSGLPLPPWVDARGRLLRQIARGR